MSNHRIPPHLNPSRLKTSLKIAISKLKFVQDKKTAMTKQQRRQLADLLNQGKESSAQIRVENIIRDDIYIELLEFLELYCELLLARITILLDPNRIAIDKSLNEAAKSIVYSAPYTELKELTSIRDILIFKYGQEFLDSTNENIDGSVPNKILIRCQVDPPSETLVNLYLCEIARAYGAPYSGLKALEGIEGDSDNDGNDDDDDEPNSGIGIKNKSTELVGEVISNSNPNSESTVGTKKEINDYDALRARFAALKGNT